MLNKPSVTPLFIRDIHFVCGLKCLSVHRSSGTSRTGLCWRFAPGRVKTVWTRSTGAGWPTCTSPRTTLFWSLPAATSRYVYTQTFRLLRLLAVCIKFRDSKGSRRLSLVGRNKSLPKTYIQYLSFFNVLYNNSKEVLYLTHWKAASLCLVLILGTLSRPVPDDLMGYVTYKIIWDVFRPKIM